MEKEFIICDCLSEILLISHDKEDQLFYLNMYINSMYDLKPNFFKRIKNAIIYIFKGKYYADQLILNKENALKLMLFLRNNINNI